jgi:hypothetical protein
MEHREPRQYACLVMNIVLTDTQRIRDTIERSPGRLSSTETVERQDTRPSDPDMEHGKVAHIIRKSDQMRGYVLGEEITALCGERFIPTRDPYQYPVCEACRQALTAGSGAG